MDDKGCLFYDANILFDLIAARLHRSIVKRSPDSTRHLNAEGLHNEAKEAEIPRLVSTQTHDLLEKRVTDASNFLAEVIRDLTKHVMTKKTVVGSDRLALFEVHEDIFLVEDFLFEQFRTLRPTQDWEKESLRSIERLIVRKIQGMADSKTSQVDTEEVVAEFGRILVEFNEISDVRKNAFTELKKEIQVVDTKSDPPTEFMVRTKCLIMDSEDVPQLAIAIQHQRSNNSWVVFVSTDYKHIIAASYELYQEAKLVCSQPLYAIQHLRRVIKSKGKLPHPEKAGYIR